MIGDFHYDDADGDGEMDLNEFVLCMTTKLEPSVEMALKTYAHNLVVCASDGAPLQIWPALGGWVCGWVDGVLFPPLS